MRLEVFICERDLVCCINNIQLYLFILPYAMEFVFIFVFVFVPFGIFVGFFHRSLANTERVCPTVKNKY